MIPMRKRTITAWLVAITSTMLVGATAALPGATPAAHVAAARVGTVAPVGVHGRLVFDDEFDGSQLDRSTWDVTYPWGARFNAAQDEAQCYGASALSQSDGALQITATRRTVMCDGHPKAWRSGLVQARRVGTFTYGYLETRAKLPGAAGMWPAIWMLPTDLSWPPEIDVAESFGRHVSTSGDLTRISLGLHYGQGGYIAKSVDSSDFTATWHTFAVDWQPRLLRWYVDGVKVFSVSGSIVPSAPEYPLLDLAVARDGTDLSTPPVATMSVDYVRVWQLPGLTGESR